MTDPDNGQELDEPSVRVGDVLQITVPLMAEWKSKTVQLRVREIRTENDGSKTLLFEPV